MLVSEIATKFLDDFSQRIDVSLWGKDSVFWGHVALRSSGRSEILVLGDRSKGRSRGGIVRDVFVVVRALARDEAGSRGIRSDGCVFKRVSSDLNNETEIFFMITGRRARFLWFSEDCFRAFFMVRESEGKMRVGFE